MYVRSDTAVNFDIEFPGEPLSLPLCPDHLNRLLSKSRKSPQNLVLVCVGTDRIIGDSLGPLVGSILERTIYTFPQNDSPGKTKKYRTENSNRLFEKTGRSDRLKIYGTLLHTVHARILADTAAHIRRNHTDSIVIAVDASLGEKADVGSVFVRAGNLRPGAGVNKNLPRIGDITITGIAGEQSRHPYLTLQTVRLSTVVQMAEQICSCILEVCEH